MHKNQKGFHPIPLLLLLLVIGVIGFAGYRVYSKNKPSGTKAATSDIFAQQYGANCPDKTANFSSPPMALNLMGYIRPLGAMSDGHVTPTDHAYIIPADSNAADNTVPILMPADGKIVQIDEMPSQYIGDRTDVKTAPEDHRIVMSFSCRYYSIFIHVHKLSDKLHAVVGTQQQNTQKQTNIDLKAGELIGYIGGAGVDWLPIDLNAKLGFLAPESYNGEPWKIHTVSPFDLYSGSLKTQLEAKSLRSVAPLGGKIDYDLAGKLIGNWFQAGTNGYKGTNQDRYWDGHLAVAPDYIDPATTIVSIGNWQGAAKQFVVKGSVDPAATGSSAGLVKYELVTGPSYVGANGSEWTGHSLLVKPLKVSQNGSSVGTIAFQVMPGEKLKVEEFPGKSAAEVSGFTSAAQIYER